MIKMSRKAKKAMAVALTAGMLASTATTPVFAATKGWQQNSKGWWYQNADGSYPANKWSQINGKWYYFDANGYMLANKWVADKAGKWYYVGANGAMKTNAWAKDKNGLWYWLTGDGSMFEGGWGRINGEWYFFKNDGVMQSGVVNVDGETYYLGAPEQGWMQTGTFSIAGTEYTFDAKSGACTSEKAPAASKYFDGKGNEVTPSIDVEEVAGITGKITNALPDFQEKYGNVLIAGSDAYLKILVTDNNGKPVANTAVSLTTKAKSGSLDNFNFKGLNVQTTDANGYATFVIGAKDSSITATSNVTAVLSLTATVVATNQNYETTVAFARVNTGEVKVVNHESHTDDLLEIPSTNFSTTPVCNVATTKSLINKNDGGKSIGYVFSQQVNDKDSEANKVEIEIDPKIEIPVLEKEVVSDYYQEINKEIKEYSVYQDGGSTSFRIDDIPKGLLSATLNVSATDISEYTQVNFELYKKSNNELVDAYTKKGAWTQKDFGYQIPLQNTNEDLYMIVRVISEGQVNDKQNAGIVIKDIKGVYDTKNFKDFAYEHLNNSVKWTTVKNQYSDIEELSETVAKQYIPAGVDSRYTAAGNKYKYQVPVFPYTGNAIMTVTDANNDVVGYFTIPTKNNGQNKNVLDTNYKVKAILVSYDEAFNDAGTIKTEGNKVIVNSEKTGITALQAKITLPGFEDEIDLTNDTFYTSIQWAPVLNEAKSNDFYALTGQNVIIKAQLVDNQGNPVSGNKDTITFTYDNKEIPGDGTDIVGTDVTVVTKDLQTDAKGQAVLKVTSGSADALLESLEAKTSKYNVVLTIGGETVKTANLRWVQPGLSFTSAPEKVFNHSTTSTTNTDYIKVDTLINKKDNLSAAGKEKLEKALAKGTNQEWILGYEVVGLTQNESKSDSIRRNVLAIEGLKVDMSKSAKGDLVTEGMANGTVKLSSTEQGGTKLKGTIDKNSLVAGTDVYFYVDLDKDGEIDSNEKFKNVGEGTPSIDTSLELPITWGVVGQQLQLVSPKGKNFVVSDGDQVYVKLTDAFDGVIGSKDVELTITYTTKTGSFYNNNLANSKTTEKASYKVTTSPDGLIPIKLDISDVTTKYVTITAKYENTTLSSNNVITYKEKTEDDKTNFALVNAVYTKESGKPAVIEAVFNHAVDKGSISKEMFSINDAVIDKVEVDANDNKKVKITLSSVKESLDSGKEYTLSVDVSKTVNGVKYTVCDSNGKSLTDIDGNNDNVATVEFNILSSGTKLTADFNGSNTITVKCGSKLFDTVDKNKFIVVYNGADEYITGATSSKGIKVYNGADDSGKLKTTITVDPTILCTGDITIYYNGGSVTISKDTIKGDTVVEDAKQLTAVPTVASVAANQTVTKAASVTAWKIQKVELVDNTGKIFATVDPTSLDVLKTANPFPTKGDDGNALAFNNFATAKVKITYVHTRYTTETRVVKYDVKLDNSTVTFTVDNN